MVKFTLGEVRDLIISMAVVALAFAYFLRKSYNGDFLLLIPATIIAIVPCFVFHELAHKFMAAKYGFDAEYKMLLWGLFLTVVTSSLGVILAAPGEVRILGDSAISKGQDGKIAVVGPLINIILAFLFLALAVTSFAGASDINSVNILGCSAYFIGLIGFFINSFMAAINMLPLDTMDGAKVFKWNKIVWTLMAVISFPMAIIPLLLIYTSFLTP